jgi:hypothetical protein
MSFEQLTELKANEAKCEAAWKAEKKELANLEATRAKLQAEISELEKEIQFEVSANAARIIRGETVLCNAALNAELIDKKAAYLEFGNFIVRQQYKVMAAYTELNKAQGAVNTELKFFRASITMTVVQRAEQCLSEIPRLKRMLEICINSIGATPGAHQTLQKLNAAYAFNSGNALPNMSTHYHPEDRQFVEAANNYLSEVTKGNYSEFTLPH